MEEDRISFIVAKLAKEKGFLRGAGFYYSEDGELKGTKIGMHGNPNAYGGISAPTQASLQKWLREVYHIQLCLRPIYGGDKIEGKQTGWLCYTPFQDEEFNKLPSISLSQYTYEESLEEGLLVALKLINID
jgi:hypothetical protein